MATTTTATVLAPVLFPFAGLDALPSLDRSWFPRGVIAFESPSIAITAAGAGEDQLWTVAMTLPIGYAYIITDVHVRMQGAIADLAGWDKSIAGNFGDTDRAIPFDGVNQEDVMVTTALDVRTWTFPDLPTAILINSDGTTNASLTVGDHTTDDGAMTGSVFASFLVYDVEQAHHVRIHTPQLFR